MRAPETGCVEMRFDAGMQSRFCPAFEIRGWRQELPRAITVDGHSRRAGRHYTIHLDNKTLVMQYLGVLSPGIHILRVGRAIP